MENYSLELSDNSKKDILSIVDKIKNPKARKRAYASLLGINTVETFLKDNNISSNKYDCCSNNHLLLEEFDVADIKANNSKLDVRIIIGDNTKIYVPKNHKIHNFTPDFYIGVRIDSNATSAEIIGFIESAAINSSSGNSNYITVESIDLKPVSELINSLNTLNIEPKAFFPQEHDKTKELFLSYIDNEISSIEKEYLIRHLSNCNECLRDFNILSGLNYTLSLPLNHDEIREVFSTILEEETQEPVITQESAIIPEFGEISEPGTMPEYDVTSEFDESEPDTMSEHDIMSEFGESEPDTISEYDATSVFGEISEPDTMPEYGITSEFDESEPDTMSEFDEISEYDTEPEHPVIEGSDFSNDNLLEDTLFAETAESIADVAASVAVGSIAADAANSAMVYKIVGKNSRRTGLFGKIKSLFSKKKHMAVSLVSEKAGDLSYLTKSINNPANKRPVIIDNDIDIIEDNQDQSLTTDFMDDSDTEEINPDYSQERSLTADFTDDNDTEEINSGYSQGRSLTTDFTDDNDTEEINPGYSQERSLTADFTDDSDTGEINPYYEKEQSLAADFVDNNDIEEINPSYNQDKFKLDYDVTDSANDEEFNDDALDEYIAKYFDLDNTSTDIKPEEISKVTEQATEPEQTDEDLYNYFEKLSIGEEEFKLDDILDVNPEECDVNDTEQEDNNEIVNNEESLEQGNYILDNLEESTIESEEFKLEDISDVNPEELNISDTEPENDILNSFNEETFEQEKNFQDSLEELNIETEEKQSEDNSDINTDETDINDFFYKEELSGEKKDFLDSFEKSDIEKEEEFKLEEEVFDISPEEFCINDAEDEELSFREEQPESENNSDTYPVEFQINENLNDSNEEPFDQEKFFLSNQENLNIDEGEQLKSEDNSNIYTDENTVSKIESENETLNNFNTELNFEEEQSEQKDNNNIVNNQEFLDQNISNNLEEQNVEEVFTLEDILNGNIEKPNIDSTEPENEILSSNNNEYFEEEKDFLDSFEELNIEEEEFKQEEKVFDISPEEFCINDAEQELNNDEESFKPENDFSDNFEISNINEEEQFKSENNSDINPEELNISDIEPENDTLNNFNDELNFEEKEDQPNPEDSINTHIDEFNVNEILTSDKESFEQENIVTDYVEELNTEESDISDIKPENETLNNDEETFEQEKTFSDNLEELNIEEKFDVSNAKSDNENLSNNEELQEQDFLDNSDESDTLDVNLDELDISNIEPEDETLNNNEELLEQDVLDNAEGLDTLDVNLENFDAGNIESEDENSSNNEELPEQDVIDNAEGLDTLDINLEDFDASNAEPEDETLNNYEESFKEEKTFSDNFEELNIEEEFDPSNNEPEDEILSNSEELLGQDFLDNSDELDTLDINLEELDTSDIESENEILNNNEEELSLVEEQAEPEDNSDAYFDEFNINEILDGNNNESFEQETVISLDNIEESDVNLEELLDNKQEEDSSETTDISDLYQESSESDFQEENEESSPENEQLQTEDTVEAEKEPITAESSYLSNFVKPESMDNITERSVEQSNIQEGTSENIVNSEQEDSNESDTTSESNVDTLLSDFNKIEVVGKLANIDIVPKEGSDSETVVNFNIVKKEINPIKIAVTVILATSVSLVGYVFWKQAYIASLEKAELPVLKNQDIKPKVQTPPQPAAQKVNKLPAKPKPVKPYVKKVNKTDSSNLNDDIAKAIAYQSGPVKITNISWEVSASLASDPVFKNYLMVTGQALKSALATDLTLATDRVTNNVVKIQIILDLQGNIIDSTIQTSSGSGQVDKIVLRTLKNTLSYTKLPFIQTNKKLIKVGLIVNL